MAVKRIGAINDLTREFAREHSDQLWKQLVLSGDKAPAAPPGRRRQAGPAGCGSPSAWPSLRPWRSESRPCSGSHSTAEPGRGFFYLLNISFFAFPVSRRVLRVGPAAPRCAAGWRWLPSSPRQQQAVNAFPFAFSPKGEPGHTFVLTALHLPIALWLGRGLRLRRRPVAGQRQADGFHPLHRRAVHLLRADRARAACSWPCRWHLRGHRHRSRAVGRELDRAVRPVGAVVIATWLWKRSRA